MSRFLIVAVIAFAFGVGMVFGHWLTNRQWSSASRAERTMALRLYRDVQSEFGSVRHGQPGYEHVKGTVHLWKDLDFAVYEEGDVRTIRVYSP